MSASQFHFYKKTFTTLDGALTDYVSNVAGSIIGAIKPVATTLLTIYVMLWGWSMLRGMINEPITDGVSRVVRLAVIVGLALDLGSYNGYIANFLWNSPDAIAAYIASGYSDSGSNVQYLDSLMSQIYDFGNAYWEKGVAAGVIMPDIGMMLIAILIWAAGIIATGYGAFLLCLAKMGLAIILAVGPIFVLLTIFDSTKRFFDVWLGQALNFVFMVMLAAAGIKLILTILQQYLTDSAGVVADPAINQAIPAVVLCLIGALVLVQVPGMASALGGGVAVSTMGAVGWAYGKAAGAAKSGRDLVSGKTLSDMRAQRRAQQANARWAASNPSALAKAGGAPMAVYRKVTGANRNRAKKAA